ncbi:MAG: hypothetical protein QOF00_1719 [Pseudonocardiales bacterium]|jgi:hypothetical protein|nr:hypothetical protein [Pseudonocardiales bacterium]
MAASTPCTTVVARTGSPADLASAVAACGSSRPPSGCRLMASATTTCTAVASTPRGVRAGSDGRRNQVARRAAAARARAAAGSANTGLATSSGCSPTGSVTVSACPRRTVATGLPGPAATIGPTPCKGSPVPVGAPRASTASTPGSDSNSSSARPKTAAGTVAVVSTGSATAAVPGSSAVSAARVPVSGTAICRPARTHAPAARTPAPPALLSTATRGPAGSGWRHSASSPGSSVISSTASTPVWANNASHTARGVALPALCEAAADRPASELPERTVRTGIRRARRRARIANTRGRRSDST